jgi:hypothetical protein
LLGRNVFFKDYSEGKEQEYVEDDIRKRVANGLKPNVFEIGSSLISHCPLASAKIKRFEVRQCSPGSCREEQQAERSTSAAFG